MKYKWKQVIERVCVYVRVLVCVQPGQGKSVRLFEYVAWNSDSSVPPSSASLLSLLASVERWQQRSGNKTVLVNCRS